MASRAMRQKALEAAQARRRASTPPKPTALEEAQDEKPFQEFINKIRGSKQSGEALILLKLLHKIFTDTHNRPTRRVKADRIKGILQCEPAHRLFLKVGFLVKMEEMQELYTIPSSAERPLMTKVLLETALRVLQREIDRLTAEEQIRWEMREKEKLADKATREKALKNIEDDRRRVAQMHSVKRPPRFVQHSGALRDSTTCK